MLGKTNATANIAVKDLATAKKFYEGTLGLKQVDAEGDEADSALDSLVALLSSDLDAK